LSCKVEIDEFACLAHGDCAHVAPHAFVVDDIARHTGEGTRDELIAAADACPAGAITITDAETGEQLYP
jgi:ferredoxin